MNHTTNPQALREAIRRTLAEADGFAYEGLEPHDYQRHADALIALLPAVSPSVVVSADRATLRDRIAEALAVKFTRDGGVTEGMRVLDDSDLPVPRRPRPVEVADAVLAVLPAPTDRATLLRAADLLRRVAAEEQPTETQDGEVDADTVAKRAAQVISTMGAEIRTLTQERNRYRNAWHNARARAADAEDNVRVVEAETQCGCGHAADEHSVYGCIDGCGCDRMFKRPPMDAVHILGIDAARPAVGEQPDTQTREADRTVAYVLTARTELHCLRCTPNPAGDIWTPVSAEELDDGGICTACGRDVLIPAEPAP